MNVRLRLFITVFVAVLYGLGLLPIAGCEKDDGGGLVAAPTDDCGFPVVSVPEGCDDCHGAPPDTGRHPPNHRCFRCHGYTIDRNMQWVDASRHQNGAVDYAVGCTSCHGWTFGTSPPQDLAGDCDPEASNSGAHEAMRRAAIPAHQVNCINCHQVPVIVWEAGHIDGDNRAEVRFANLAVADGAAPAWDGERCSGVYCHGATLTGGFLTEPEWTDTSGRPGRCGACHWIRSPGGDFDADCSSCHPTTVMQDRQVIPRGTHLNGHIDLPGDGSHR